MRTPPPSHALAELEAQHEAIRKLMERCEVLADELDAGRMEAEHLTREVVRLRLALDTHNRFEEQILRPVLREEDAFADVRIDRMVEDHVGEHRAMRDQLDATETRILRETLKLLRAHLEGEEQYLLNAKVLHDDLVSLDGSD
jgi:iron-sulfur cluster repair protein YtfE (RIC family)